jgi:hypothetical protein
VSTALPSDPAARRLPPLRAVAVAVVCAVAMLSASAQGTGDKPERADGGSAQSSLERAQRLAGNPLRAILEAGRMKRRPGETVVAEVTVGGAGSPTASAGASQLLTLPSFAEPGGGLDNARLPLTSPVAVASVQALPPLPSVSDPAVPAAGRAPLLLRMVEPLFSPDLAPQLARLDKVSALLTLRPDGSVAEAVLQDPMDRELKRVVLRTLLQWQYDTAPAQRLHRVELVFNAGR